MNRSEIKAMTLAENAYPPGWQEQTPPASGTPESPAADWNHTSAPSGVLPVTAEEDEYFERLVKLAGMTS